MNSIAFNLISN